MKKWHDVLLIISMTSDTKTLDSNHPAEKWMRKMQEKASSDCTQCLYKLHADRVYHKCLQMTKSEEDAHDLSQEIWIKVQKNILKFNNKSSHSTWLYSIAHNHCIDFLRKRNRRTQLHATYQTEQDDMQSTPNIVELQAGKQEKEFLLEQIKRMAQGEKTQILWMKYGNNMSVKEIGAALNLSISAVKMRLQRARRHLRREIEQQFPLAC